MLCRTAAFVIFLLIVLPAFSQRFEVEGFVRDKTGEGLSGANLKFGNVGASTRDDGSYRITLRQGSYRVSVSYVGFQPQDTLIAIEKDLQVNFILDVDEQLLEAVQVEDMTESTEFEQLDFNEYTIDSKAAARFPSAFGDFSRVLVTLPGVSSNNELSSGYSVRGGNFDENLVYVDDIPVYRPFLSNAGQQEGLNFINADLVKDISFFAGGWEAKYGDKLSSNLVIEYKTPVAPEGSVAIGLLGGSAYFGSSSESGRFKYIAGVRHRDSRYLLNTLEVDGQYFPTYSDGQALLTFDLSKKNSLQTNKTTLNWLVSYSRNRYLTIPTSQTTDFGSVSANLRIQTAFQGREILNYDTYQTGFRLTHRFTPAVNTSLIGSAVYTREDENYEVEGAYRLCDVENNPNASSFDECISVRGFGSQLDYGRNQLNATIFTAENRYEWLINEQHVVEAGIGVAANFIDDELNEYSFRDSADFVTIDYQAFNSLDLTNYLIHQFLQWEFFSADSVHILNAGIRSSFWSQNNQWLISPRLQYQLRPSWKRAVRFNFSAGLYQQPPFYRELRSRNGQINRDIGAQKSIHLIAGVDRFLRFWNRPFLLSSQVYYKHLYDLIPYEIDNVRLRYYPDNNAEGYAAGVDLRINGEFIRGTQSWFSIGYLKTSEFIPGDGRGEIRRPLDQRLNLGVYFEDYMPMDSTIRVYVNLVFGSGYPLGPPGSEELRNIFSGDEYYRADIGLSKEFYPRSADRINKIAVRLEVLNAFAADNTLSYTWIEDVTGTSFAIPNSLSARFFNLKVITYF